MERGQIVKISKSAKGVVTREQLTKHWTDWIDYWSVDFDFENKREIIRVPKEINPSAQSELPGMKPAQKRLEEWEEVWTGALSSKTNGRVSGPRRIAAWS